MGGGSPRCGVLILRGRWSVKGGSEVPFWWFTDEEKFVEEVGCGGVNAWGLGYPFCSAGGFSVSNMCATESRIKGMTYEATEAVMAPVA
jgi:hypothetical protein